MEASIDTCIGHTIPDQIKLSASAVSPRRAIDPARLTYHVLRPGAAGPADVPLLGEAYRLWTDVWHQTLLELDDVHNVRSDEFTRQDDVGAIFHGYECIALSLFRWVDLAHPMHCDDSYLAVWPQAARDKASRQGSSICIGSNITIAPEWRNGTGCSLKTILAALIIERFERAGHGDALVGTMRIDRGMDKLMDRVGAERLGFTVEHHGVDVELFAYFRGASSRPKLEGVDETVITKLSSGIRAH
jgi:hypothetical protein